MQVNVATLYPSFVFFAYVCKNIAFSEKFIPGINNQWDEYETKQQPEESEKDPNDSDETDERTTLEILRNIELPLALLDGLFTIQEAIEEYILPRPETEEDTIKIVKRLEDSIRPNMYDVSQYKTTEDAISRALFDMLGSTSDDRKSSASFSELQKLLWLERARHLDGDIILLMEGLLGQPVAGADLMKNIKENFKVNLKNCKHFFIRVNEFICWPVVFILLFKFYFHSVQRHQDFRQSEPI